MGKTILLVCALASVACTDITSPSQRDGTYQAAMWFDGSSTREQFSRAQLELTTASGFLNASLSFVAPYDGDVEQYTGTIDHRGRFRLVAQLDQITVRVIQGTARGGQVTARHHLEVGRQRAIFWPGDLNAWRVH